jgi:hypothetical protein
MSKLKEFFKFWFRFSAIFIVFAFFIWAVVTVGSYNEALGVLVALIGIAGFVSAGTVYLDVG